MELERPVTRWRRENTRSRAGDGDPNRPKSRRGSSQHKVAAAYMDSPTERSVTPSRALSSYYRGKMDTGSIHTQRERLVSQQGLNLARTGTSMKQSTRLVRDKRYFLGALQLKMSDLAQELSNIRRGIDQNTKEQASFTVYDKRVKQMASELTEMQGLLADHNMAIDKINTGTDVNRIVAETKELFNANESEVAALESLFSDRVRRQEANREIEEHIVKEKYRAEQLAAEMNSSLREKFLQLKAQNNEQSQKVATRQAELDSLMKTKAHIGDQVYISPGKTDVVQLELKLWELDRKKEALNAELQVNSSPEEQRSALLNKLKSDNAQMATMKKSINEIQDQIKHAEQSMSHTHQVTDEEQGMRQARYMELKKREETIEEFLSNVENHKEDENIKLRGLEAEIVQLLKKMAKKVVVVPTAADFKSLQNDNPASTEVLNTMKSIGSEHKNLSRYLNKVEVMSNKVETELKSLTNSMDTMRRQLASFSNTAELESKIDAKRLSLTTAKAELEASRVGTKTNLKLRTNEFNEAQRALVENEQHAQISYIEKRLAALEQSNHAIKEYLEEAKCGEDLESCRLKALDFVAKLNLLIRNNIQ
ncbi:hypothetical protein GE061_004446 [Apolygus lucorum]|uniref:Uncharacterized protein n=1 Tax=Apolygus lucorum TaxID=248454 RepID=A0A8S9X0R4_APOLU|nr:hypothetical protein GE061_004446 [Apolygus lucorum]